MISKLYGDERQRRTTCCRSSLGGAVRLFANVVMFACLAAALWGVGAEAFCLSVFFLVWIMRIAISVAIRWLEFDPDTVIYFAPWVRVARTA